MKMFKIRNRETGQFVTGDSYVSEYHCDDTGEMFTKQELQDYVTEIGNYFRGYEVVEFEVTEIGIGTIADVRKAAHKRRTEEQKAENAHIEAEQMATFGETF